MSRRYVVFSVALRRIPVRALSFRESVVASFSLGSWSRIVPIVGSFEAVSYRSWGSGIVRVGDLSFRSCSSRYRVYPLSPLYCSFVRSVSCWVRSQWAAPDRAFLP